jgi:four helix bundle protein
MTRKYITLEKLEAYILSRNLSETVWTTYSNLPIEVKWKTGMQLVNATDSTGANIAEGYGRFHYLDKVKFYYNARGSLLESRHWVEVLNERGFVPNDSLKIYRQTYHSLRMVLGKLIKSTLQAKTNFEIS